MEMKNMLKEFSVKALSILLTMCISSSMFAVSANALNNEKKVRRVFLFKKVARNQFHQKVRQKMIAELII